MGRLATTFGVNLSEPRLTAYHDALGGLPDDLFLAGIAELVATWQSYRGFPYPGDIGEAATPGDKLEVVTDKYTNRSKVVERPWTTRLRELKRGKAQRKPRPVFDANQTDEPGESGGIEQLKAIRKLLEAKGYGTHDDLEGLYTRPDETKTAKTTHGESGD